MTHYICLTCGTQYPDSQQPPANCPICEDDRQYIGHNGQLWTTHDELQIDHHNVMREVEPNLIGIGVEPRFAIGQRALLIKTEEGNILWDCISLLEEETITAINELGGIDKIAISHAHYYGNMIDWSKTFDAPIYIHADDQQWVMRPDDHVKFWDGDTLDLGKWLTLIRAGGHYDGAQVLHWAAGAGGKGVLLTGDIINVVADRRYVSFMYSYPNQIPLSPNTVRGVVASVDPFDYDRIYSAWFGTIVKENAKAAVEFSADRYIKAITD